MESHIDFLFFSEFAPATAVPKSRKLLKKLLKRNRLNAEFTMRRWQTPAVAATIYHGGASFFPINHSPPLLCHQET